MNERMSFAGNGKGALNMIRRVMFCTAVVVLLGGCGESSDAEERFFDHYQESVERAEEVQDRLQEAEERRRRALEEHES
jgi:hypothetical protein